MHTREYMESTHCMRRNEEIKQQQEQKKTLTKKVVKIVVKYRKNLNQKNFFFKLQFCKLARIWCLKVKKKYVYIYFLTRRRCKVTNRMLPSFMLLLFPFLYDYYVYTVRLNIFVAMKGSFMLPAEYPCYYAMLTYFRIPHATFFNQVGIECYEKKKI